MYRRQKTVRIRCISVTHILMGIGSKEEEKSENPSVRKARIVEKYQRHVITSQNYKTQKNRGRWFQVCSSKLLLIPRNSVGLFKVHVITSCKFFSWNFNCCWILGKRQKLHKEGEEVVDEQSSVTGYIVDVQHTRGPAIRLYMKNSFLDVLPEPYLIHRLPWKIWITSERLRDNREKKY